MKSKIFKDKYSDLSIEVFGNGWINLSQKDGSDLNLITLGKPPNKRVDLLLKAIEYSQKTTNACSEQKEKGGKQDGI